jgi:putative GTP pyrophosphokinase
MLEQSVFFQKYNLEPEYIKWAKRYWSGLISIYENYSQSKLQVQLEDLATAEAAKLRRGSKVHSIKVRVKDPEHLIEKLIRNRDLDSIRGNYIDSVTDLVGLRALHLFKDEWIDIHNHIDSNWIIKNGPIANVREGDSSFYIKEYERQGCKIEKHESGYRSIHYKVGANLRKSEHIIEIQVRTIFEEGWSEIDHKIRYPYNLKKNETINRFLEIFNRLAGSADEMGSFIEFLQQKEEKNRENLQKQLELIAQLQRGVTGMKTRNDEEATFVSTLEDLHNLTSEHISISEAYKEFSKGSKESSREQKVIMSVFKKKNGKKKQY